MWRVKGSHPRIQGQTRAATAPAFSTDDYPDAILGCRMAPVKLCCSLLWLFEQLVWKYQTGKPLSLVFCITPKLVPLCKAGIDWAWGRKGSHLRQGGDDSYMLSLCVKASGKYQWCHTQFWVLTTRLLSLCTFNIWTDLKHFGAWGGQAQWRSFLSSREGIWLRVGYHSDLLAFHSGPVLDPKVCHIIVPHSWVIYVCCAVTYHYNSKKPWMVF